MIEYYLPSPDMEDWASTLSYDQLRRLARNKYGCRVYQRMLEFTQSNHPSLILPLIEDDTIPFGKYSCHVAATAAEHHSFYRAYARELLRDKSIHSRNQQIRSAKLLQEVQNRS